MNYYSETSYWKKYNLFLPEDLQYKDNKLPTEEYWQWKDYAIHLDRMKNADSPFKVIILHGAGGNGRVIGLFGNFLHNQGYEYVAPDLIGYGLTKNPKNVNIDYSVWIDCISDFIDQELIKDSRPIILFGLSVGGMLAYQVAAKNKNVKGIIVTTLADPRSQKVKDDLATNMFLSRIGLPLSNAFKLILDSVKLPIKWLCKMEKITNDSNFSKVFSNDKLAGGSKVKLRFLRTYMNFTPAIEPENYTSAPLLFLQPDKDNWTTLATSKPFYDRLNCPKKLVLLENCGHAPYEEPGLTTMKTEIIQFLESIKS
ncbi:alpha/beta hydrolase [Flavobacterium sp. LS1R49]|uniref:Alpha/beta hydrolase n=1 Tax=Flavobacterium shii TaxID=2987687 RepID=A0A9X3C6T9_9FLAO|nr:alpha/beta hydrolase [Flavobacterium shii]MCV9927208.1 alpha/beta hydrolase [Flavobacterium shii]